MKILKRDFKCWLQTTKQPDAWLAGNAAHCPLAVFLDQTHKNYFHAVYEDSVDYDKLGKDTFKNIKSQPLPIWAKKFVKKIDRGHHIVSKESALKVLEAIS